MLAMAQGICDYIIVVISINVSIQEFASAYYHSTHKPFILEDLGEVLHFPSAFLAKLSAHISSAQE